MRPDTAGTDRQVRSCARWSALVLAALLAVGAPGEAAAAAPTPPQVPHAACKDVATCEPLCHACTQATCTPRAASACFALGQARLKGQDTFDLAAAATAFDTACTHGVGLACSSLGLQLQDGRGVPADEARAARLYARACDAGVGVGCFNRGLMHQGGVGFEPDQTQADRWFARARNAYLGACDGGRGKWCVNLGVLYEEGLGVARDPMRAHTIYAQACAGGDEVACASAARMELQGDVPVTGDPAARLSTACDRGSPVACAELGQDLALGHGMAKDMKRALPLLKSACVAGERHACGVLGGLLGSVGTPAGDTLATWYETRACDLGASDGCLVLGLADLSSASGAGSKAAARWLDRACTIGSGEACFRLGALLAAGVGAPTDPQRAKTLIVQSCRLGFPNGCFELVRQGDSLPLPPAARATMRNEACAAGVKEGCGG